MADNSYIDEEVPWPSLVSQSQTTVPETSVSGVAALPLHPSPLDVLRHYWGHDSFRGIQEQIITSILARRDTLGLMPTGGGKSITFQVPALMQEGTCIVITPLVALMKDQVAHLRERGIKATCIHSGLSHDGILREFDNCILGHYKFLYISPERLHSELFRQKLQRLRVSFITIDEAHCISQWGYDFRPSYLQIKEVRRLLPDVPVLALTATATPTVVDDIAAQLNFRHDSQTFRMSFARANLDYQVVSTDSKHAAIINTLRTSDGSAIVYTRSRSGTRDFALMLQQEGFTATYYHAGLSSAEKDTRQQMWQEGRARIMVATNAFGMGIDKADVRQVLHLDPPDSLEAYFQEAGRAGRDGQAARAILYFSQSDERVMRQRVAQNFPPKDKVRAIYDDIACFFQLAVGAGQGVVYEFDIDRFCRLFHYFPVTVEAALTILQRAGYLLYSSDDESKSRVMFIVRRDDLYDIRLHAEAPDRVMYAILRHYEGLFSDYVVIDEALIAKDCDLDENDVYEALLALTRRRILHYIPRRRRPSILYQQHRVDHAHIVLSPAVYDERMQQYAARIGAVIDYLNDDFTPRSEQLLAYFGETVAEAPASVAPPPTVVSTPPASAPTAAEAVGALLADRQPHSPAELRALPYDADEVNTALLDLLDQGVATLQNGCFVLTAAQRH